jgi:hypothetical protein
MFGGRDRFAQKTYAANFGKIAFGDITSEKTKTIHPCPV